MNIHYSLHVFILLKHHILFFIKLILKCNVCYGSLLPPKLANGVEITCEVLLKIAGQGCVYVRLLEEPTPVETIKAEEESISDLLRDMFDGGTNWPLLLVHVMCR